ncbi:putative transcription factor NAM family [Helianthus annuus]|nr:putative transcription factor NAM family [Helianthus annuus]
MVSKSKTASSGGKCFPPGFRFHPTDEELVLYYLKRKICRRSVKLDIIADVDVYKWDPEELPGQSKLKTGDRQWFFFSPSKKYANGGRSSRATMNGYWKATGKDRIIKRKSSSVGIKKTLVYYHGRAPSGQRTDWVMHEYTMDEEELKRCPVAQEHYVLYKIFKKSGAGPKNGEQYGAPFVEEEWNDEDCLDCLDVDSLLVQKPNPVPLYEFGNTSTHFLELDDLVGPDTRISNSVTDFYSISDFDFYHESQGVYNMGHLEYGPGPGPENLGLVSEVVNNVHELHDELPVSYDLWNHCDQSHSSIMTVQTVHEPVPSSGVVIEENLARPEYYPNQCPENMENNTESWFSSAVWAFVDSIPTTPASASESSAVVNKAFERMSSFSRGRNVNLAAAAASGSATKRLGKPKPSSSSRGIVYFSVFGVLFAILWVFVGSSIELLSRFVWL